MLLIIAKNHVDWYESFRMPKIKYSNSFGSQLDISKLIEVDMKYTNSPM